MDWRFCLLCEGGDDVLLCGSVGIVKQMLEEVVQAGIVHVDVGLFDALF